MREVDLRLVPRWRFVADEGLRLRPECVHVIAEPRDAAGIAGRSTLGEQSDGTQQGKLGEARLNERLERLQLRRAAWARPIARLNGVNGLIEQPCLDPAIHRGAADAEAARCIEA